MFGCTRGQHSIAREASISPIFGGFRPGFHFSARFFLVGLPLARLTGPPPGTASAVPAPSRGGVRNVRNAGPIPYMAPPYCHCTIRVKKYAVPLSREYPICTSLIFSRLHAIPLPTF